MARNIRLMSILWLPIAFLVSAECAFGQTSASRTVEVYPDRPIRLIAPFPIGGGADSISRIVGTQLGEFLKKSVVVDNRPGAGGTIGADITAKSLPDGYTLLMGNSGPMAASVGLYKKLPYDPVKDFSPISLVATASQIIVVSSSSPTKSLNELVKLAKSKPRELSYAFGGVGSQAHLAGILFARMAGIEINPVPYKGGPLALIDLLGGRVFCMVTSVPVAAPLIKDGTIRALAVTGSKRSSGLPDVPRLGEFIPGYEVDSWWGVVAPAGTPRQIIGRLNAEITRLLEMPDVKKQMLRLAVEPTGSTPAEFSKLIREEVEKWPKVIKEAGIQPQG